MHQITIGGIAVDIVRKPIKNLHLGVYPPNGRVRVAAPLAVKDAAIRLAVIGKLGWIKRQRARFEAQPRQSKREMVNGESHYFLGRRYRLRIIEQNSGNTVLLRNRTSMHLHIRPGASAEQRERVLSQWYREQLRELIPPLIQKWQKVMGVRVSDWGIKRMKTKWGSCNCKARRIWLNLELAKKPVQCLEYIIVHEMVHLLERHHNERFTALMEEFIPRWRIYRDELNSSILGHEKWNCSK